MKKIVVATNNKGKLDMIKELFSDYEVLSLNDFPTFEEPEENGKTFEENAIIKAKYYSQKTNEKCLADDSGICIPSLDNFPGVRTKRWFEGTDRERNLALIKKVDEFSPNDRKINFITSIAVANGEDVIVESASITGNVSKEPRGENGFGFDEIFELENGKTLAEITFDEKLKISTRKMALEKLKFDFL